MEAKSATISKKLEMLEKESATEVGSKPQCVMQFRHFGLPEAWPYLDQSVVSRSSL